ncbi:MULTISPECIES: PTS sugar transporter subunit IIA [Clostridium]|uniref:PTS sugar transporter subunit IIA n=1 Tax=Clostridium TaxID=1485 RepID=UPI00069D28D2|nr:MULTISPECIES: PTS sugar transporter subunit IIA [Clostridium]KOF58169.1 PTS system fructose subfamily transporter subunit IIA [Clostridium sp. DMHC 10]MCD2348290.1 PTS sugar transporter subunit IIA [Clostridium guangxiense]
MIGIIAISHGPYAKSLIESVEMVYGKQEKVKAICLGQDESLESLQIKINDAVKSLGLEKILIIVDLLGGTPYNATSMQLNDPNINVITGLNMPMLLHVLPHINESLEEVSKIAIESGKNGIVNVSEKFRSLNEAKGKI